MKFTTSQTSFKSGRLSPKLFNRVDTSQYRDGASIMRGMRPLPEGGATKPFPPRYVNEDAYNPLIGFDESKAFDFMVNGRPFTMVIVSNSLNQVDAYVYRYPYVHGTEEVINLIAAGPTNYSPDLFDYAVVDNYLILTHFSGRINPKFLLFDEATGDLDSSVLINPENSKTYPMSDLQESTLTVDNLDLGNRTIEITSTDPDVVAILQGSTKLYLERLTSWNSTNYVGSNFYIKEANIPNGVRSTYVLAFESSGVFRDYVLNGAGTRTVNVWAYDIWGPNNYPKTVTGHEGRVVFGGTPNNPLSFFGSAVNSIFHYNQIRPADTLSPDFPIQGTGILPTDPYVYKVNTKDDTEITNLSVASDLFIGTDRKEYIATGGDTLLSNESVNIRPYTAQGSYPCNTTVMENAVVYTDSTRKKLFSFRYNDANGSFVSQELTLLFSDLMEDDLIRATTWSPFHKVLYVLTENDKLYGITYDSQVDTIAFFETGLEDVTAITKVIARENRETPHSIHRGDHLFMLRREKGIYTYDQIYFEKGVDDSYIKYDRASENAYLFWEDAHDIVRDADSEYSVNDEIILTGSDNFPIIASAGLFPPFNALNLDTGESVVINEVTLDGLNPWALIDDPAINGASRIVVGKEPTTDHIIATMPVEAGQQWGTAQMGIKNIDKLGIRHYKSYSYEISSDNTNWQDVRVADKEGNATNGREQTSFSSKPEYDKIVYIRNNKAEPLNIVGINMRGVSNDG